MGSLSRTVTVGRGGLSRGNSVINMSDVGDKNMPVIPLPLSEVIKTVLFEMVNADK